MIELGSHSSPFEVTRSIGNARVFEVGLRLILVSLEEWISKVYLSVWDGT